LPTKTFLYYTGKRYAERAIPTFLEGFDGKDLNTIHFKMISGVKGKFPRF
jgi:hypothetical protein